MKRKYFCLLAVFLFLGGMLFTSCADSTEDNPSQPGSEGTDVVVMYYAIGGGDLDAETEDDFADAANAISYDCHNVRYFVQFKYSSLDKYNKTNAKQKAKSPRWNYVMSGDPGCVYRFELSHDRVNPNVIDEYGEALVEGTGAKCFTFKPEEMIGNASFRMYDPENLTDFIQYCMKQTPEAKAYVLCLGDHGGGWMVDDDCNKSLAKDKAATRGVLYDDNLDGDCMSSQEIATALKALSATELSKLMLIDYDCCMMNSFEALGELLDNGTPLVPYVLASGHSVSKGDQATFCRFLSHASGNGVVTPEKIARQTAGYIADVSKGKRDAFIKSGKKEDETRNIDYTITNMSNLPSAFAAIKDVTDFLLKQDVSDKDAYSKAASGCYQFYNKAPFYDVMSYFYMLQEHCFKGNAAYAALYNKADEAIRKCQYGHEDYSYSLDPENGKTQYFTYAITIGCNASAYDFILVDTPPENTNQGAIMTDIGADYQGDKYFNQVILADGSVFVGIWEDEDKKLDTDILTNNRELPMGTNAIRWANSYQQTNFDKATGWSKWMEKNPGLPDGNPPAKDYRDRIGILDLIDDYDF